MGMLNQKGLSSLIIVVILALLGIGFYTGATTQKSLVSNVSEFISGPEPGINSVPETTSKSSLKTVGKPSSPKPFTNPTTPPTASIDQSLNTSDSNAPTFIKITYPNGGENFKVGDILRIRWESNNLNKNGSCVVTFTYYTGRHPRYGETQRGAKWASVNTPDGYFDWELYSDSLGSKAKVEMECYDTNSNHYLDRSDDYFSVSQ